MLLSEKSSCEIIKRAGWNKQGQCVIQASNLFREHASPIYLCLDHMRVIWDCGGNSWVI